MEWTDTSPANAIFEGTARELLRIEVNTHIHPMGVVATDDLEYLAEQSGDAYHQSRADDGIAWLMNTMELYPETMGYGRYGVLSERTCPSDGLLAEVYYDDNAPASTWWRKASISTRGRRGAPSRRA